MPDLLVIAATDLRRRVRSRSALITAFLAPLALPVVFGFMFGSGGPGFELGVADDSGSPVGARIISGLAAGGDDQVRFIEVGSGDEARRLVENGRLDAAIVLGSEVGGSESAGGLALTAVGAHDRDLAAQVAASVAHDLAARIDRGGADGVTLHALPLGGRPVSFTAYFGAAMAIVFLFFTVSFAARSILDDRKNRTLDRILAGPTRPSSIILGKVVSIAVLAVAGFVTVWLVTTVAFGATWGNPPAVMVLILFTVFALSGVALFVASLARSPQQSDSFAAVVTFVLALLGGNFTGPTDTPDLLRSLSRLTPNGWALRGFTEVSVDAASVGSVGRSLAALALFGLVFGAIGLIRFGRTVAGR